MPRWWRVDGCVWPVSLPSLIKADHEAIQGASSGVTDGGRGANRPSWQAKSKSGPHLAYILVFSIRLVFSRFCSSHAGSTATCKQTVVIVLGFSEWFLLISGFIIDIYIRFSYYFLTFYWVLASGPPTVVSGPPSATFSLLTPNV